MASNSLQSKDKPAAVVADIDGTLAATNYVSEYAFQVLQQLSRNGIPTIIVTGRSEPSALEIARNIAPEGVVISNNGALISDVATGRRLVERTISVDYCWRVINFCQDRPMIPTVFTADDVFLADDTWAFDLMATINALQPVTVTDWSQIPLQQALKVMVGIPESQIGSQLPALLASFPEFMQTLPNYVETNGPGVDKETAVPYALQLLGIEPGRCLGFGDGQNDAGWLAEIGRAVVPCNAYPETLAIADEIIGSNRDDSVAHYLTQYL